MDHRRQQYNDPWDDRVYGTGNTMPPKSHGTAIALLLILVIFLSGVISFLGFLNIKLVWQLNRQAEELAAIPISFSDEDDQTPAAETEHASFHIEKNIILNQAAQSISNSLGLEGEGITRFDQQYFQIPAGLYLTEVEEGSDAYSQGVEPGDILLSLNGTSITSQEELETFLLTCSVGDTVDAVIYRDETQIDLTLTLTENRG